MSTPSSTAHLKFELVDPTSYLQDRLNWLIRSAQITIDTDTGQSEQYLKALLPLIKSKISSIELVRGYDENRQEVIRGAFLMNEGGSVVVHVTNALIGYGGSGPHLTRQILKMFGFSEDDFEVINDAARPTEQHYALVLHFT